MNDRRCAPAAMSFLKLQQFDHVIRDCNLSVEIKWTAKAVMRRGTAYANLKRVEEALKDFEAVLQKEPGNAVVRLPLLAVHACTLLAPCNWVQLGHSVQTELILTQLWCAGRRASCRVPRCPSGDSWRRHQRGCSRRASTAGWHAVRDTGGACVSERQRVSWLPLFSLAVLITFRNCCAIPLMYSP